MNAALDRIEAVLDEPELSDNGKQHIPAQAQPGQPEVLFNDVTFAYQDKEVLHHISFAMKKNSMTALVGPSGSGKSTIANLLARLWDVKSGNVTIRGVDIRNVPLSELMNQISMVFQRVYLFQDTIYTPKEARYGALCGCCPVHGSFKTQRMLRSRNFTRGRFFDNRRKPLYTPDRPWPGCGRKNLRTPLLFYLSTYSRWS